MRRYYLNLVDYQAAWALQKDLVAARGQDLLPDTLLLLQHPHTYTLGSSGKRDHLLMSEAELQRHNVTVLDVDRGGDITYHGPGQLVGYPILKLPTRDERMKIRVVDYIRQLEAVIINAIGEFGVEGQRLSKYTGVWVDVEGTLHKMAAIGVKVNARGITMHGFALNVNTDMNFFAGIIPCGIDDKPVISLQQLLGQPVDFSQVSPSIDRGFEAVFGVEVIPASSVELLQFSNVHPL
ncbi:MAG: lipoyl(octanoyl) transferase LipB [Chloroflexi bacterium]|nr:lipoyl(octanoyl) transferase LipB [Chloroflexota bacterium]